MIRSNTDRRDRWTSYWLIQHLNTRTVWYNLVLTMILLTGYLKVVSLRRRMKIRVTTLCFWLEILRFSLRHKVLDCYKPVCHVRSISDEHRIVINLSSALCKLFRDCQSVRQSLKSFQTLSDTRVWVSDFHSERDCLHAIMNLGWALSDLFRVCQISHLDCHTANIRLSTSPDISDQKLDIRHTTLCRYHMSDVRSEIL